MLCVQNPMWQQAMQQLLSNPEMLRSSVDAAASVNPQIRQMLDRDPSMRCPSSFGPAIPLYAYFLRQTLGDILGDRRSGGLSEGHAAAGRTS